MRMLGWNQYGIIMLGIMFLASCSSPLPEEVAVAYRTLPAQLDFNLHVKPILSDKCFACHGPDEAKVEGGLQLHRAETAYAALPESPGGRAIVPGRPGRSELVRRILSDDPDVVMPLPSSHLTLSAHEKAVLVKWIEDGAEYKPHWAFIPPGKPTVPEVEDAAWAVNPIDHFIARKLTEKGMAPSPEASRELLLRRLALDLTGLPPEAAAIDAFLADTSVNAYEKQVDRLLDSPHFGERLAMDWMDVARFADTHGYSVDRYRDMSPWRDWVIQAFNDNMPYDRFITWQLAGDLMEEPTKEQRLATAFNRLHPQNMEGGIVEEEFRVEYVLDRVNTAGAAFMGLTLGCARCHDHKYDPISQKEYFQLSSFFNNVNEAGQISWDDAMPVPTMLWTDEKKDSLLAMLERETGRREARAARIRAETAPAFSEWFQAGAYRALAERQLPVGLIGQFSFDGETLQNQVPPFQAATMKRNGSNKEPAVFVPGKAGPGLQLNGDAWLDCAGIGKFTRVDPFSIGIQVKLPAGLRDGVIFHKGSGAALYNFRGLHLALKDNQLELLLAHTAPDNAIMEYGGDIPRNEWVQLTVTYDGSSEAAGYRLYVNGRERETTVAVDNLYKDIDFRNGVIGGTPGIQVGARWRGRGIKGAVVDDLLIFDRELSPPEVLLIGDRSAWQAMIARPAAAWSYSEKEQLLDYYLAHHSSRYRTYLQALRAARKTQADSAEVVPELMVMKEMERPRPTYVLERGQYDAPGERVFPGVPEAVLPWPEEYRKDRRGFARWLLRNDHPLTARVAVNRYWQLFFGRGLVRTAEDFGNQGELPSHPELLDWLAIWFQENDWNVKALCKLIVRSATYRQASSADEDLRAIDPENKWLARAPQRRLASEMLRDHALRAAGLLDERIGGKSVFPYQPEGLWAMSGGATYRPSMGADLYRRSLYTVWKRTAPHPTLATFDQPERSECTLRRQETNTPLQALVLLNDPTFVEAAKVMGETMAREPDPMRAIAWTYRKLTCLKPGEEEMAVLRELHAKEYEQFRADPMRKAGWLSTGEYKIDGTLDQDLVAAHAVVASVILNSDAFITLR